MKNLLLLTLPLMLCFSLSAQITQEEADDIIRENLLGITAPLTVFAKDTVQTNYAVLTSTNEKLKMNYPCWVYYVIFPEETNSKYLIVKESNGNIFEINARNDEGPEDLEEWRVVVIYPIEIPIENYSLAGTSCQWTNLPLYGNYVFTINSDEEIEQYVVCTEENYPEIDFSVYTLLLAVGWSPHAFATLISREYMQISRNEYTLNLKIHSGYMLMPSPWRFAFLVPKVFDEEIIILNVVMLW